MSLPIKNLIVDFSISKQVNHTFEIGSSDRLFLYVIVYHFVFYCSLFCDVLFAVCLLSVGFSSSPHFHFRCFPKNTLYVFSFFARMQINTQTSRQRQVFRGPGPVPYPNPAAALCGGATAVPTVTASYSQPAISSVPVATASYSQTQSHAFAPAPAASSFDSVPVATATYAAVQNPGVPVATAAVAYPSPSACSGGAYMPPAAAPYPSTSGGSTANPYPSISGGPTANPYASNGVPVANPYLPTAAPTANPYPTGGTPLMPSNYAGLLTPTLPLHAPPPRPKRTPYKPPCSPLVTLTLNPKP